MPRDEVDALLAPVEHMQVFLRDELTFRFVYELRHMAQEGRILNVFHYVHAVGSGGSAWHGESTWTVGVAKLARAVLPELRVAPRGWGERFLRTLVPIHRAMTDDPAFERRFSVRSEGPQEGLRRYLGPAERRALAAGRPTTLEASGRYLVLRVDGDADAAGRARMMRQLQWWASRFDP